MSKSAESDLSRINLLDDADAIASKIKRAKTDAFTGLEADNPERPEARNLLTIYSLVSGMTVVRLINLPACPDSPLQQSHHGAGIEHLQEPQITPDQG